MFGHTKMIKLKEELKNFSNNKLSRIKVIAKQVRSELESHYNWEADKGCFKNTCSTVTTELQDKLRESGIYSYMVNGLYLGASDDYEPDMAEWSYEDSQNYYDSTEDGQFNEAFGFNHWWIVAENRWIIDVTSDQFHPDEPEQYRIVITDVGDDSYCS